MRGLAFECPGCGHRHTVDVRDRSGKRPSWEFNGDMDKPTLLPSVNYSPNHPETRCHFYVQGGKIRYLGDSHHELAGKTVDMIDLPADGEDDGKGQGV
jgi:hypothetical protein